MHEPDALPAEESRTAALAVILSAIPAPMPDDPDNLVTALYEIRTRR